MREYAVVLLPKSNATQAQDALNKRAKEGWRFVLGTDASPNIFVILERIVGEAKRGRPRKTEAAE